MTELERLWTQASLTERRTFLEKVGFDSVFGAMSPELRKRFDALSRERLGMELEELFHKLEGLEE